MSLILLVAAGCLFVLLLTLTGNERLLNAYWPFQVGVIYLAAGVFMGRSLLLLGGWLVLVAVVGLFFPGTDPSGLVGDRGRRRTGPHGILAQKEREERWMNRS
ncbi:MAG: hypothetical protein GX493_10960 [Firmicutes bacterium]|nr:hypothetical protein [Bacillota bacterium]